MLHSMSECMVLHWLYVHLSSLYEPGTDDFTLVAGGFNVCVLGFCLFYGISHYKFTEAVRHVRMQVAPMHGNHDRNYDSTLSDTTRDWL